MYICIYTHDCTYGDLKFWSRDIHIHIYMHMHIHMGTHIRIHILMHMHFCYSPTHYASSLLPSLRREGAAETATVRKRSDALVKYYGLAREVFIFYIILLEQMQYS